MVPDMSSKARLGRPSNNLKMGIVGLPNVGKSSFFNVLTSSSVSAQNYPFCTIDPQESIVAVSDSRFDWLCEHYKPQSKVPAHLTVIDIAGLVRGASKGEGLGNAFLSHIKAVDAIFHMVRAFTDENIVHVDLTVDPVRDIVTIHDELREKDLDYLENRVSVLRKQRHTSPDKAKLFETEVLDKCLSSLKEGKDIRRAVWNNREIEVINPHQLLTAKPMIYLINISKDDFLGKKNRWLSKVKQWVDKNSPGDTIIPISVDYESEIIDNLNTKENQSVLNKIVSSGYKELGLINFFTVGPDEVRSWTIREGTKAPQAAGVIHTDFERGFIAAEVMRFEDLREAGSPGEVKMAGKCVTRGKDYLVESGNIIVYKFNVTKGKKGK